MDRLHEYVGREAEWAARVAIENTVGAAAPATDAESIVEAAWPLVNDACRKLHRPLPRREAVVHRVQEALRDDIPA